MNKGILFSSVNGCPWSLFFVTNKRSRLIQLIVKTGLHQQIIFLSILLVDLPV